jgi:hypothetical protein
VTVGVLMVLLVLVGLPLLAWWLGGRKFWGRLEPGAGPDPWGDFVRRHRLTVPEQTRLGAAVERGHALDDQRLRRAAVELAEQELARLGPRWAEGSRLQRLLVLVALVWFVLLVSGVVFALTTGGLSDVPWLGIVTIVAVAGTPLWRRRNLKRALELNSGPPSRSTHRGWWTAA